MTNNSSLNLFDSTGSLNSQTVTYQLDSSIPNLAVEMCTTRNNISNNKGKENTEKAGLDCSDSTGTTVDPIRSPTCERISSHATETSITSKYGNTYSEHSAEISALSLETNDNRPSKACFQKPVQCHELKDSRQSLLLVGSCEGCTFKDGQIFALVRVLHMSHHGLMQPQEGRIGSQSQKRLPKGMFTSIFYPYLTQAAAEIDRAKSHQNALISRRVVQKSKEIKAGIKATNARQMQVHPTIHTRSGRVSKATHKILHSTI